MTIKLFIPKIVFDPELEKRQKIKFFWMKKQIVRETHGEPTSL